MHFDGDRGVREWAGADKLGLFIQLGVVDNPWPMEGQVEPVRTPGRGPAARTPRNLDPRETGWSSGAMGTQLFAQAAAAFRSVLKRVSEDQLGDPTPCEPLNVAELISRAIGHQDWVKGALPACGHRRSIWKSTLPGTWTRSTGLPPRCSPSCAATARWAAPWSLPDRCRFRDLMSWCSRPATSSSSRGT